MSPDTKGGPQGGTCLDGHALTVHHPSQEGDGLLVFPLPVESLLSIVPEVGVKRDRLAGTRLSYFTDFLWLPVALVADVVSTARVRRS